jgi:hypothetical protein
MIRLTTALAACGLLAACSTGPQAPRVTATLGPAPVLAGGTYDTGGGLTVAAEARERQGRTMICGVWAESAQQSILTKNKARGVLDTAAVSFGGQTVVRGLRFMAQVPPMADYAGQEATCTVTARPWQAGDEGRRVEVRIPRQVVHREIDEQGGFTVVFRPTGPGAGGS